MRRGLDFLLRNWPLKLGAVVLATVLYGGVALSESTRVWPGQVPIEIRNAPADAALLTVLDPLESIEYRAPIDVASRLTSGSFQAYVDLENVEPERGGSTVPVAVQLVSLDPRVQIVDYGPTSVNIEIDPVQTREIPVTVDRGAIPEGLDVDPAQVSPSGVTLRGASTRIMSVRTATARVTIDGSAINVDQEVDVLPLDETGNLVPGVAVTPQRVRVRIAVARQQRTATLPIVPNITGTAAPGFAMRAVSVEPLSVTVSGEEPQVAGLTSIQTAPIDLTERTEPFTVDVPLALPPEVSATGLETVRVAVRIDAVSGSRTLEAGLRLDGAQPDLVYALSGPSVLVRLSGLVPVLDAIDPAGLVASLDVTGLGPGSSQVEAVVDPPNGVKLEAVDPLTVGVVISTAAGGSPPPASPAAPSP